jgi:hypothetical protein
MSRDYHPKQIAKAGYRIGDYGMDYIGAVEEPMDTVIGSALLATGQEYARRTEKDMKTNCISVTDAGAGMRVFAPADALIDKNVVAISLDLEGDEDISSFKMPDLKMPDLKQTKTDPVCEKTPPKCKHCEQTPCILNWNSGSDLDDEMSQYEYMMKVGDDAIDSGLLAREVRCDLYRIATCFHHGHLGRGVRKELPLCVVGEIKDSFPAKGGNYTGFKEGFLNK